MKRTNLSVAIGLLLAALPPISFAHTPPETARVFFVGIANGDRISNPISISFGIEGFGITPAGTKDETRHNAGHHHLLIDTDTLPDLDEPIPQGAAYRHFDAGETEAKLELPLGRHSLQLLLGDEDHEPQDPALYSEKIWVTVE